jgi:thiol-disulfide isomerase/thioredoxin
MSPRRAITLLATTLPLLLAGDAERPAARDGSDLLGTPVPALAFERWIGTPGGKAPEAAEGPVLYRWWTGGCSFCESSLPAIDALRRKYEPAGLRVVAVYHPKPVRDVEDETVRAAAAGMGYGGVVAVDADWSELKRLWLDAGRRPATSVTVLADADGVIRFVHPGPALFPSDEPDDADENGAFIELERAVGELLARKERP